MTTSKSQKRKSLELPQNGRPPKKSKVLLDDESVDDEETNPRTATYSSIKDHGIAATGDAFVINQDFARRFEHNKKREELQQRTSSLINPGRLH